jgi:CubicO group peptidase (beta-lactamase class C family)
VLASVDEALVEAMNEHTLAGLAVGIVHHGRLIYSRGLGFADVASHRPVDSSTVFRVGSISKTFTAIALMQLCEQGKVDLDRPVNDYLKSYWIEPADPSAPPTLRHFLTHTGGIGELRSARDVLQIQTVVGLGVPPGKPLPSLAEYYGGRLAAELPPGRKWAYANHAFATLGQVVEDVSGQPFGEHMRRQVFEPLGMEHTDFLRSDRVRDKLAVGYAFGRGRMTAVPYLEIAVGPAGSVFSSVEDMAKYVAALMNGGRNEAGSVIKPETLARMYERQYEPDERLSAMGLAFMVDSYDGHRVVGHDGGWPGFISSMLVAPDDDLGVIAFTNTSSPAPNAVASRLLRGLLGVEDPAANLPRKAVLERPDLWPELVGDYGPLPGLNTNLRTWMSFGGEVRVFVKGSHLALGALVGPFRQGLRLYPTDTGDPLAFSVVHEQQAAPVLFKRGTDGRVDRIVFGMGPLYKRPHTESLRFRALAGAGGAVGLGLSVLAAKLLRARRCC